MQGRQNQQQNLQPQNNPAMSTVNMIKNAQNPNMVLNQLARNNPNVANAMNLVNQYGGNPRAAFYAEAKRLGVNPNQILGMLK